MDIYKLRMNNKLTSGNFTKKGAKHYQAQLMQQGFEGVEIVLYKTDVKDCDYVGDGLRVKVYREYYDTSIPTHKEVIMRLS